MPELPEVETIRRQLCAAGVEGRRIKAVRIEWPRTVEPLTPAVFSAQVTGRKIETLSRHGKWLIFELCSGLKPGCISACEGGTRTPCAFEACPEDPLRPAVPCRRDGPVNLLIHLRMTGGFHLTRGAVKKGLHDRVILQLDGGLNLHFRDPRKFGRWRLAAAPDGLGPDALGVTRKRFFEALDGRNQTLKALLLDQSFVAGIGNIYADEALFEARLDPRRKSGSLSGAERAALYAAVKKVLRAGVRNKGTSLGTGQGNYLDLHGAGGGHREQVKAYGRAGKPCMICGQPLHKIRIGQRTTVFCIRCQT